MKNIRQIKKVKNVILDKERIGIYEMKDNVQVWIHRSDFVTKYYKEHGRVHMPTGYLTERKYIAYTEEQLIRKSKRTKTLSNKPMPKSLIEFWNNNDDMSALDTLWDIEIDLGIFDCNDSTYSENDCPLLWFQMKNMIWFTEESDGRICPVCDQRTLNSSFFPDIDYLAARMVDKNRDLAFTS